MKAHELLADPKSWIRGQYARDSRNYVVKPDSTQAVCWCIKGAVIKCYGEYTKEFVKHTNDIRQRIETLYGVKFITNFNDDISTTHEQVVNILKGLDV